jgi:hypothetical protein
VPPDTPATPVTISDAARQRARAWLAELLKRGESSEDSADPLDVTAEKVENRSARRRAKDPR